ncbi:MAG TPA: hypothetical protein VNJ29_00470 [Candidatus Nitrosotenuis sp.]|jgi:hypothetical protein|nr:hypothetical protein [Candidatus Nitrosotenuis sp.]
MKQVLTMLFIGIASVGMVQAKGLHGAYLGVAGGISLSKIDFKVSDNDPIAPSFNNGDGHITRPNGVFFIGYGHHFSNCVYAGAEAQLDTNFSKRRVFLKDQQVKIDGERKSIGYAFLARLGYAIIPMKSMIYIGAGIKSTNWSFRTTDASIGGTGLSKTARKRAWRFYAEGGFEGAFNHNDRFGWRMSYSVMQGKRASAGEFPTGHILDGAGSFSKFKPTEHLVRIGIFYRH